MLSVKLQFFTFYLFDLFSFMLVKMQTNSTLNDSKDKNRRIQLFNNCALVAFLRGTTTK